MNLVDKRIIIITESQYKRLFLEQTAYTRHLDRAYSTYDGAVKQMDANREVVEFIGHIWDNYKHEIIDVAAIVVLAIPVAGPFISIGLELANAGLYFAEGDEVMGGLSALLAVVPGGMIARRALKKSGIVKQIDNVTEWMLKRQKAGKTVTKEQIEKKLRKELSEKTIKNNDKLIKNYFDEVLPTLTKGTAKKHAAKLQKLINKTQGYWKDFVSNEKLFKKFLLANNDSTYKAYIAYLRSVSMNESFWGMAIYSLLMAFGDDVVTFVIEESPYVQKKLKDWKKSRLEDDAKRGNISSIVMNDGYPWKETKEMFMSDGSIEDNKLLKGAWKAGWRPDSGKFVPQEFWTDSYRKMIEEKASSLDNFNFNREDDTLMMDKYNTIDQNVLDSMLDL